MAIRLRTKNHRFTVLSFTLATIMILYISGFTDMVWLLQLYTKSYTEGTDIYCLQTSDVVNTEESSALCTNIPAVEYKSGDCDIFPHFNITYTAISDNISCKARFCTTIEGNKQKIDSFNLCMAEPYLNQLKPSKSLEVITAEQGASSIEIPVFVGALSSNHITEALLMLKNLNEVVRPAYPTAKLYFFDLGLRTNEISQIQDQCNCTIVQFPFDMFPRHVRCLFSYTWKPLIIKIMLQTYRFVMWMDTSVRFKTSKLDSLFIQAKQQGIMSMRGGHLLPLHVHEDTFMFLQEPPCLYRDFGEFYGTMLLFHSNNKLVYDYIFTPWVKCALIEECMKTRHPTGGKLLYCPQAHDKYHSCHRYDQAVLSLLIYRLFHNSFRDHNIDDKYVMFERV